MSHTFHAYLVDDVIVLTILADGEDLNACGDPVTTIGAFREWAAELRDMGFFDADVAAELCEAAERHVWLNRPHFVAAARDAASRLADALSVGGANREAVAAARRAVACFDAIDLEDP